MFAGLSFPRSGSPDACTSETAEQPVQRGTSLRASVACCCLLKTILFVATKSTRSVCYGDVIAPLCCLLSTAQGSGSWQLPLTAGGNSTADGCADGHESQTGASEEDGMVHNVQTLPNPVIARWWAPQWLQLHSMLPGLAFNACTSGIRC